MPYPAMAEMYGSNLSRMRAASLRLLYEVRGGSPVLLYNENDVFWSA
jgi:hypothetical protein